VFTPFVLDALPSYYTRQFKKTLGEKSEGFSAFLLEKELKEVCNRGNTDNTEVDNEKRIHRLLRQVSHRYFGMVTC